MWSGFVVGWMCVGCFFYCNALYNTLIIKLINITVTKVGGPPTSTTTHGYLCLDLCCVLLLCLSLVGGLLLSLLLSSMLSTDTSNTENQVRQAFKLEL